MPCFESWRSPPWSKVQRQRTASSPPKPRRAIPIRDGNPELPMSPKGPHRKIIRPSEIESTEFGSSVLEYSFSCAPSPTHISVLILCFGIGFEWVKLLFGQGMGTTGSGVPGGTPAGLQLRSDATEFLHGILKVFIAHVVSGKLHDLGHSPGPEGHGGGFEFLEFTL